MKDLYRLQDGTVADPKDCAVGKDGVLRHKTSGSAVAMTADNKPQTIEAAAESGGNVAAAKAGMADEAKPGEEAAKADEKKAG